MTEDVSFAARPEFILFIAGAIMTLGVVGFLSWLMWNIFKEEREAKRDE
jgi:hypothetical protein